MTEDNNTDVTTPVAQDEESLIDSVKKQIEYYFSRENLQSDTYLQSQMDAHQSVPISIVMKFAKLKALTTDESIVRKAVSGSSLSIMDNRIKANVKPAGRSTIILREIPSDAPEIEVKEIFNFEGCGRMLSIRSDIGDTWFVVMEDENEAKRTALDLRLKKRTFRGIQVKAGIKTEQVVRSYYPVNPALPPAPLNNMFPVMPFPPIVATPVDMSGMPGGMMSFPFMVPPPPNMVDPSNFVEGFLPTEVVGVEGEVIAEEYDEMEVLRDGEHDKKASTKNDNSNTKRSSNGHNKSNNNNNNNSSNNNSNNNSRSKTSSGSYNNSSNNAESSSSPSKKKSTSSAAAATTSSGTNRTSSGSVQSSPSKPPVEINAFNFPPLHEQGGGNVAVSGQHSYAGHTLAEIVAKTNEDFPLPFASSTAVAAAVQHGHEEVMTPVTTVASTTTDDQADLQLALDESLLHHQQQVEGFSTSTQTEVVSPVDHHHVAAVELPSPPRISSSSWAALVKSHVPAADIATQTNGQQPASAATTTAAAPRASNGNSKESVRRAASSGTANGNGKGASGEKESRRVVSVNNAKEGDKNNKGKDKDSNKDNHANNNGSASVGKAVATERSANYRQRKETESSQQASSREDGVEVATSEAVAGAPASGKPAWGSKTSFASVLKQNMSDDALATSAADEDNVRRASSSNNIAAMATAASSDHHVSPKPAGGNGRRNGGSSAASASASTTNSNSNNSLNSQQRGSSNAAAIAASTAAAAAAAKRSFAPVEVGGVWAKETLPPLKKGVAAAAATTTDSA